MPEADRYLLESDLSERCIAAFCGQLGYSFGALVECETDVPRKPAIRIADWMAG